jgi:hypothetical protein
MTPSERNTARMAIACATIVIAGLVEQFLNLYTHQQDASGWPLVGSSTAKIACAIAFFFVLMTFYRLYWAQTLADKKSLLLSVQLVVLWSFLHLNRGTGSPANISVVNIVQDLPVALLIWSTWTLCKSPRATA